MATTTSVTVYFCTYRNKETAGAWRQSKEYGTMSELLAAMLPYLEKHPFTTVSYQTRVAYVTTA